MPMNHGYHNHEEPIHRSKDFKVSCYQWEKSWSHWGIELTLSETPQATKEEQWSEFEFQTNYYPEIFQRTHQNGFFLGKHSWRFFHEKKEMDENKQGSPQDVMSGRSSLCLVTWAREVTQRPDPGTGTVGTEGVATWGSQQHASCLQRHNGDPGSLTSRPSHCETQFST